MRLPELDAATLGGEPGRVHVKCHLLTTGQAVEARWDGDVLEISKLPANPPDRADTVVVVDVLD